MARTRRADRVLVPKEYRTVNVNKVPKRLHVARAERALGKSLPPGAVVHHADGTKNDDAPLVICQDHAYHMFLHRLLRVRQAGGDPHTQRICYRCRQLVPVDQLVGNWLEKPFTCCVSCNRAHANGAYAKKKAARA